METGMSAAIADTLDDIDEALSHAQAIPMEQRGQAWYAYTDRLLEMRQEHTTEKATT